MEIAVVGGFYGERCVDPHVDEAFGSGGRAAIALAIANVRVNWSYYCPELMQNRAQLQINHANLKHIPRNSTDWIRFRYFHPLSKPTFTPSEITNIESIEIESDIVLRFGMMEGDAIIKSDKCIYDPQSLKNLAPFSSNGSTANRLAIILNAKELLIYGKADDETEAVRKIFEVEAAEVIVVKAGVEGCRVYERSELSGSVPPFWSESVYKIGSGDVFSAAFAYQWALKDGKAVHAADQASRCVARYCESRTPTVEVDKAGENMRHVDIGIPGQVYIAGPFFTMAQLWLVEEAYAALRDLGAIPFSPYHAVGFGEPGTVVEADLKGLSSSNVIFAILDGADPGTMFEIGYAVRHGIPVVALSQDSKEADLTMLLGSPHCSIKSDFATAIYHAIWEACR